MEEKKEKGPLTIVTYGDPVLRQVAKPVEEITPELQQLAREMLATMYNADGVGLAAPQVGRSIRLIVIDLSKEEENRNPLILFNPEVFPDEESDIELCEEGCLSVPGIWAEVARYTQTVVTGLNIDGQPVEFEANDYFARAVQHEIDHLEGRLFVDRVSPADKALMQSKLKKMARKQKR